MIDMKFVSKNVEEVTQKLRARDPNIDVDELLDAYHMTKSLQQTLQEQQTRMNHESASMASLKDDPARFREKREELRELSRSISTNQERLREASNTLDQLLLGIPNIIQDDVPISQDKDGGRMVTTWGEKPVFSFAPEHHVDLAERLGIIDFSRATKLAGSGFPLYRGMGARLELGLIQFMLDSHIKNGYEFILPPLLNNSETLTRSGNLPKFADQLYAIPQDGLFAIPTAEVPLTSLFAEEIIELDEGPRRLVAYTPCFRREAGSHGQRDRGLMRMHQFNKVELYGLAAPQDADDLFYSFVQDASNLLNDLELHYRVVNLPSCDLALQSSRTHDIEIWLPFDQRYSEVSSASHCTDYQSRRANIRYRQDGKTGLAHTINCSGLATPRVMVALLEQNQEFDGSVTIPDALRPYVGVDKIFLREQR